MATIHDVGEDLLQIIVAKLPALPFASAACVSRSWNCVCGRVLSRPKLSSACSVKPTLEAAFEEVANKVLSEPIRPQFAIACVNRFSLEEAKQLMTAKLSSKVPFIIGTSAGLIGRDACWTLDDNKQGMMLTVGFAPGLKVKSISLAQEPQTFMIDQFIGDIKEFSTSISGCPSPSAIMMFGRANGLMNVMEKLDNAMPPETVIVGACDYHFEDVVAYASAFALVFVMERNKPPGGAGETRFHAVLSSGFSPMGPTFKVVSVEAFDDDENLGLVLTGVREGPPETFDRSELPYEYIGVTKRRIRDVVQNEAIWTNSLSFHYIIDYDEEDEYLNVSNMGIEVGDTYQYFYEDFDTIKSSVDSVSNFLRSFKKMSANGSDKWEVCGGLIFTSNSRGEEWLGKPNVDGNAFLESFPGVTLAGTTCDEEIGRGYLASQESQEPQSARACLHRCSVVYFIISYTP
ncbi:hypothetical protein QVD17_17365 [Tagetes erecta]|uniref:F-box domain-containing protein n=1 Tax=Tagetes erecta TaxID=13708 RepID=A0AAD8KZC9_TARER|nr:hypothetical protein QVD17_17365 [Tagetes erecta]